MTEDTLDQRIKQYQQELETLAASHETFVRRYQGTILENQNRFQQIRGAIAELEFLKTQLNGATPT